MTAIAAQLGFDFASNDSQSFALEYGAWHDPEWTAQQWTRALEVAARRVASVDGRFSQIYQCGIDAAEDELADLIEEGGDVPMRMGRRKIDAEIYGDVDAFFKTCEQLCKSPVAGIEMKSRDDGQMKECAVFVEGVGTLVARHWAINGNGHIAYAPWKDSIFLASYRDGMPVVRVPYATWKAAYCADKIAMSGAGVASVPTFKLGGRDYVQTGGSGYRGIEHGRAWRICPIADWNGETYSYRSICKAWDEGICERGDDRGLVVKVRGQLCVLESAIEVFDDRPPVDSIARMLADRADDEQDEEADDEEDDYADRDDAFEPLCA